jgi:hypothetical protein
MSTTDDRTGLLNFVCIEPFHRLWVKYGLTEDDMISLENEILSAPRKGDEITGSGGFRKIRFSREESNKGKSSSYRVLYLYLYVQAYATVFFVLVFGKSDKKNISKADTKALAKRAGGLKAWAKERHDEWLRRIQSQ